MRLPAVAPKNYGGQGIRAKTNKIGFTIRNPLGYSECPKPGCDEGATVESFR